MNFTDTITFDGKPRRTGDGYLVADAKVARTGIQIYTGSEVDPDNTHGLRDRAQVRVYRSPDEVFSADSLRSYAHRPITVDHPSEMVTADNWKQHSVGLTGGEVVRDGDFVRVPMAVMDASAIASIEGGKRQLSQGYTCDVDFTAGTTTDGLEYDAVQRNIRANHTAIVGLARGGDQLKIGDAQVPKVITVDGHQVEVSDAAAIAISGLQAKLATAEGTAAKFTTDAAAKDTQIATLTTQSATKDAEIVTLKQKLADAAITPAKLRDAAKAYATTVALAKAVAPDFVVTDAMGETDIKSGVVKARLGDKANGWTDEMVAASFASLTADAKVQSTTDNMATAFSADTSRVVGDAAPNSARAAMIAHLENPRAGKAA